MAMKKEDIKPGHYWVREKAPDDRISIVLIDKFGVHFHSFGPYTFDFVFEKFDFIARIEPPEGV
jgi:hypothetical protein